ncbi:MAG: type 1 glutamine amidotransferase [Stenotrophobium sp.]
MNIHWLQHADFEDLGCIAPWLAARGDDMSCTRLYAGEVPPNVADFDALIVMGGPMNIYEYEKYQWLKAEKQLIRAAIQSGKRVLGICLGSQLIADVLGGPVTRNAQPEIGWFDVSLNDAGRASPLLDEFPPCFFAFHWHGDTFAIPPGAELLGSSEACANQIYSACEGRVIATQFHLEVTAANARDWLAHEQPAPARYVQTPEEMLREIPRFAENNRLMLSLLERWLRA